MPPPQSASSSMSNANNKKLAGSTGAAAANGQERNAYIPNFLANRPFYIPDSQTDEDYLAHQRLKAAPKDTLDVAKWYDRGRKAGPAATKYRKGACENCGAMTHKTRECLSRPRKTGAKYSGRDIQADEIVEDVTLGWDAKRDRWNGYDAREYDTVVQDYQDMEILQGAASKTSADADGHEKEEGKDEDTKYLEETDMGRSQPTSTRQLRLREDTAKYLVNLDLDSAKYDPKTRSMGQPTDALEEGDEGFVRASDSLDRADAAAFERAQRYAWEVQESKLRSKQPADSKQLHLQANPTEGEILMRKHERDSAERKAKKRRELIEKYGGEEYLPPDTATANVPTTTTAAAAAGSSVGSRVPKVKSVVSSSSYVEYDPATGAVRSRNGLAITDGTKKIARSKYPEDVLQNNHSSVWGSWWHNFTWGYACCHSSTKNSYCTGEEGRRAFEEEEAQRTGRTLVSKEEQREHEPDQEESRSRKRAHDGLSPSSRDQDDVDDGENERDSKRKK